MCLDPHLNLGQGWRRVICVFVSCVSHAFASVDCCLVVTCWERADLLALLDDVYCIFVTLPCGILCRVWYLIVSFPDLCRLSYCVQKAAMLVSADIVRPRKQKIKILLKITKQ